MESTRIVVKSILRTEKQSDLLPLNKYVFWVDNKANKLSIKRAVEDIYKVKVNEVNTLVVPGKAKRVRHAQGMTPEWKKAVVTLKKGDKIDVT